MRLMGVATITWPPGSDSYSIYLPIFPITDLDPSRSRPCSLHSAFTQCIRTHCDWLVDPRIQSIVTDERWFAFFHGD
jgi:hypothetical protein